MKKEVYDVVVLGGGAGGVPAAIRAAQLGGRAAVIEENHLGGLCMNRGCVPFGQMMVASRFLSRFSLAEEMGIKAAKVSTDLSALLERQDELVSFMRQGVLGMLNKNKVHLVRGQGKLTAPGTVTVKGEAFSFKKIIIATGSHWLKPDFPDSDLPEVVNSDYLLSAKNLPRRCLLFGNSPHLIEMAQFLHHFGSRVWLATPEKALLSKENKTIRTRMAKALQSQGLTVLTAAEIQSLKRKKDGLQAQLKTRGKEESVTVDLVLTVRRRARLEGLGLESVGLNEKADFMVVNKRMETGVEGVYAIGDVAAPEERHYSHVASSGGVVAAENAMGMNRTLDQRTVVRVVYTHPQVACVGLTSREAKQAGYEVVTGSAPLSMNPFGMITAQSEGLVEMVADKKYGEILGAHMIGHGAAEMVGQGVLAIQMEATLDELARTPFPHPTLSESVAEAARDALGWPLYLP
jgi:dihydrolipoamide dehydrogenase